MNTIKIETSVVELNYSSKVLVTNICHRLAAKQALTGDPDQLAKQLIAELMAEQESNEMPSTGENCGKQKETKEVEKTDYHELFCHKIMRLIEATNARIRAREEECSKSIDMSIQPSKSSNESPFAERIKELRQWIKEQSYTSNLRSQSVPKIKKVFSHKIVGRSPSSVVPISYQVNLQPVQYVEDKVPEPILPTSEPKLTDDDQFESTPTVDIQNCETSGSQRMEDRVEITLDSSYCNCRSRNTETQSNGYLWDKRVSLKSLPPLTKSKPSVFERTWNLLIGNTVSSRPMSQEVVDFAKKHNLLEGPNEPDHFFIFECPACENGRDDCAKEFQVIANLYEWLKLQSTCEFPPLEECCLCYIEIFFDHVSLLKGHPAILDETHNFTKILKVYNEYTAATSATFASDSAHDVQ